MLYYKTNNKHWTYSYENFLSINLEIGTEKKIRGNQEKRRRKSEMQSHETNETNKKRRKMMV